MDLTSSMHAPEGIRKIYPCSAFFYGTLMAPTVLHRVCHGSMDDDNPLYTTHQLKTKPAILHDFRRHRVRDADYPAILPHEGASVRGTFVSGLTENDIRRLDLFEGSDYRRDVVRVRILTTVGDEDGKGNVEGDEIQAETYIWKATPLDLEDKPWSFAQFEKEKLSYWAGSSGEAEYADVDNAVAEANGHDGTGGRGANGDITKALKEEHARGL